MAANRITTIKGDLGHISVLWMNFACGEPRSSDPEMASPICLVVYLKPNGAEIQMSAVRRMSAYGPKRTCRKTQSMSLLGVKRTCLFALQMSAFDAVDGAHSAASRVP